MQQTGVFVCEDPAATCAKSLSQRTAKLKGLGDRRLTSESTELMCTHNLSRVAWCPTGRRWKAYMYRMPPESVREHLAKAVGVPGG